MPSCVGYSAWYEAIEVPSSTVHALTGCVDGPYAAFPRLAWRWPRGVKSWGTAAARGEQRPQSRVQQLATERTVAEKAMAENNEKVTVQAAAVKNQ